MKKFVIGLLSLVAPMFGIASAMTGSYVAENPICNEDESKTMDIYMTGDVYTIYPYDAYWNSENDVLINNKTSVQIWSDGTSVSGCYGDTWALMSNYVLKGKPSNQGDRTLLLRTKNQAGCVLHKPTKIRKNATDKNVIFHYTIGFKKVDNKKDTKLNEKFYYTTPNSSQYFCVADKQRKNNVSECSKMTVGYDPEQQYHLGECLNYRIFRCGDGILDKEHEECDPNHPDWKDKGTCDPDTCKKSPKCNSQYNGQTLNELPSKDKLCEVGVVTNLQEDAEGWRWSCSNEAGTDSTCYAKKPNNGDFIIKKTLISETKYITGVGQELVWEIKVTASGGNVKDMRIKDELPSVLDFVSYSSQLPSGVTIDEKQPTFSDDKKTIYWQTKGILKDGDSIVLIVVTKANAMPKATDNYDNVACASPEDNPEDEECDKKPIEGMPVIEKTLTGKKMVENTGEYLTWEVKVTASGGDISGFQIWDVMPNKLKLESAKLVGETRGVSIKKLDKTTASGAYHTVYYWDTEGTLRAGKTITMLVTTKVMEMPKANEDLLNVACVVKEGYVDCDEDQPEEGNPKLWIKKHILDGGKLVKHKNVKIGDKITYRIDFGNSGDAVGTIVSIKDFLPKNVKYVSSEIFIVTGTNSSGEQVLPMILTGAAGAYEILDGVYIDIFGGITLQPGQRGYIILTGEILTGFQDQRTNFACIYDDEDLIACDDASHDLNKCEKLEVPAGNLSYGGGDKKVTCTTTSGEIAEYIEIDCGDGASGNRYITGSNIKYLEGTCSYPSNSSSSSKSYSLVCKVKIEGKEYTSNSCQGSVTVSSPGCFPAGTKVIMANGSEKNIEDVQVGDKVLSYNVDVNANEVNVVNQRIVHDELAHEMYELTINGNILKVTDVHPFYVRKSESSKDYDWIEAKNLKVGNVLLMSDGKLVKIEEINHYPNVETVYNLEVDGNHDYFVDKGYLVHNKGPTPTSCFVAGTKVTMADGSEKNIEDVKIGEKLLGSNGTVNTVLGYDRHILGNRHIWSINGGEYFVSDEHPFKTTEGWKSFVPEKTEEEIGWNIPELKIGDVLVTNHGLEKIENVASKSMDYYTPIYNFKLDGDHTYYANNYLVHNKGSGPSCESLKEDGKGNLKCVSKNGSAYFRFACDDKLINNVDGQDEKGNSAMLKYSDYKNCKKVECYVSDTKTNGKNGSKCERKNESHKDLEPQECINVNAGNFSVEEGEIFPFYWNLANMNKIIKYEDVKYININNASNSIINAKNNYEKYAGENCDNEGIAKDSMVCTFNIYNGSGNMKIVGKEIKPLYTIEGPCLASKDVMSQEGLIKAWYETMWKEYCSNGSCEKYGDKELPTAVYYIKKFGSGATIHLNIGEGEARWDMFNDNDKAKEVYGEYRIELTNVKYLYCDGSKWIQEENEDMEPCQGEFMLTNSYTVQKTPSGNLKASIEELSKYYEIDGKQPFTGYLKAVQATEYTPNDNVNKAMKKFVDKYSKLAVSVNVGNSSFLDGKNIKKVPGKSIYFVDGDITINGGSRNINKPFTIVQTKGKTTIKGNVKHNMMLLTYGNIEFEGTSCNEDQTVKGIFYAGGNLSRAKKYRNDSFDATIWCTKGGLHVQGVLIGKGFEGLMKSSRSNINNWFKIKQIANETQREKQRRDIIMNGGSVVIEYSPSIFTKSTMPPGAEDFTTALSIYKN